MAHLAIAGPGKHPAEARLGEVTVLGRDATADVTLPSEAVSRHHARISRTEDGYLLEDLWSRNGTFLNRRRVRRRLVKDGDVIDVCDYALKVHLGEEEVAGRTAQPTMSFERTVADAPTRPVSLPVAADGSLESTVADSAEVRRLRARLQAIYEVTDAVDITLTLDELLEAALDKLLGIFEQADVVLLMLKDRATETMAPRASRLRPGLDPCDVTVSTTVMERTAERRQALLSSQAARDPRFHATMSIRRHSISSLMCVPLLYHEEVTGLLYVDSRRPGVTFGEDDLALLAWVGKEINLALERARMRRALLQRQRIERDMQLAAEMQRSFLPAAAPVLAGCEFAFHHKPALGVGGDFYDFLPLGGGRLAIVVGDVAGRGVSAALLMARVTSEMRHLSLLCASPSEVLGRLNTLLVERAPKGTFVTVLYAMLDVGRRELTVASAGHTPPLRVSQAPGLVEEIEAPRQFPLGPMADCVYEAVTVGLTAGDHVVFYTDGVVDASNAQGEWYGENRLQRVVASAPREPKGMLEALLTDIGAFATEEGQDDDVTVVVLRIGEGA